MLSSARTAPKSGGIDDILVTVVSKKNKERIARKMEQLAIERRRWKAEFLQQAKNVRDSDGMVLIGVRSTRSLPYVLDCGGCGFPSCAKFNKSSKVAVDYKGPSCIFKILDLGIALGSAVKTASLFNIDNRILNSVGIAAKRLGLLPSADVVMGIPLSAKGKNIYFDRERETGRLLPPNFVKLGGYHSQQRN